MIRLNKYQQYPVLSRAINKRGYDLAFVASTIGIAKSTLYYRLSGVRDFGLYEAITIHKKLFPDYDFLELFKHAQDMR